LNIGKGYKKFCGKAYPLPEHFFTTGNERTVVDLCSGG
jgi:hypothetical protein